MARTKATPLEKSAAKVFARHHGLMRTAQALAEGIHPRTLYALRDSGVLEQVARGLFRWRRAAPLQSPDLATVAMRVPRGVICLVSALGFHELTTQIAREISVAIPKGAERPRLEYPPARFVWFSEPAFSDGIEYHERDGIRLRVYSAEKTIADCFKFRSRVGTDVCVEALRTWRRRRGADPGKLLKHARVCRIEHVIRPYLEALQ
jgi:predicted transcriptional regulator of viral defense system